MDINLNLNRETVEQAHIAAPLSVEPATPVTDVLALMREKRVGSVLICRDRVLIGIFTERDALRLMADGAPLDVPIEQVMVPDPVTLQITDTVAEAIRRMSSGGYRRLPIVDNAHRPVGVIKVSGVVHYLVEHFPEAVYNLPPVSDPIMQQREGP